MGVARDIAIIIVAFESIVIGILLAILVIQVIRLVRMLRDEVLPILNSTQETVGTVRGTATFVSDHLVQPVVKVASFSAGARKVVNTALNFKSRRGSS
ncbi:MAG TPA: hypothetical protein VGA61_08470 [Anaerolineae bacterium]